MPLKFQKPVKKRPVPIPGGGGRPSQVTGTAGGVAAGTATEQILTGAQPKPLPVTTPQVEPVVVPAVSPTPAPTPATPSTPAPTERQPITPLPGEDPGLRIPGQIGSIGSHTQRANDYLNRANRALANGNQQVADQLFALYDQEVSTLKAFRDYAKGLPTLQNAPPGVQTRLQKIQSQLDRMKAGERVYGPTAGTTANFGVDQQKRLQAALELERAQILQQYGAAGEGGGAAPPDFSQITAQPGTPEFEAQKQKMQEMGGLTPPAESELVGKEGQAGTGLTPVGEGGLKGGTTLEGEITGKQTGPTGPTGPTVPGTVETGPGEAETKLGSALEGEAGVPTAEELGLGGGGEGEGPPAADGGGGGAAGETPAGEVEAETSAGGFNDFMSQLSDMASSLPPGASPEDIGANPDVDKFISDILSQSPEMTEEQKNTVRQNVSTGVQRALSTLSARGLGRGSRAASVITQGEIMAELEIAREQGRISQQHMDNVLKVIGIEAGRESQKAQNFFTFEGQNIDRAVANRNFYSATQAQRLDEVKNAQGFSLAQEASKRADELLKLDQVKFSQAVKEFGATFGLALDESAFRQALESRQFDLSVIDSDRTYQLRQTQLVNDFLLESNDQQIRERLGIGELELRKWIGGEEIKLETVANALRHLAIQNDYDISVAQIQIGLEQLRAQGDTAWWESALDILTSIAPIFLPGPAGVAAVGANQVRKQWD